MRPAASGDVATSATSAVTAASRTSGNFDSSAGAQRRERRVLLELAERRERCGANGRLIVVEPLAQRLSRVAPAVFGELARRERTNRRIAIGPQRLDRERERLGLFELGERLHRRVATRARGRAERLREDVEAVRVFRLLVERRAVQIARDREDGARVAAREERPDDVGALLRRERERVNPVDADLDRPRLAALAHAPDAHVAVDARRREPLADLRLVARGDEDDRGHAARVAAVVLAAHVGLDVAREVPDAHAAVFAARDEAAVGRRERERRDAAVVAAHRAERVFFSRGPRDAHDAVVARRGERVALGADRARAERPRRERPFVLLLAGEREDAERAVRARARERVADERTTAFAEPVCAAMSCVIFPSPLAMTRTCPSAHAAMNASSVAASASTCDGISTVRSAFSDDVS